MTDIDPVLLAHETQRRVRRTATPVRGILGKATHVREEPGFLPGWLEDVAYVVGKPEEWLTQALGRLFTDDSRYLRSSTDIYDQVSFMDLTGAVNGHQSNIMETVPRAGLALMASVFNPLDPFNYLGIKQATTMGKLAHFAAKAVPFKALEVLEKFPKLAKATEELIPKAVHQIDIAARIKAARKAVFAAETKVAKRQAVKAYKSLQRSIPELEKVNEILAHKQIVEGIPISDMLPKKTVFEQVRAGQLTAIGLEPLHNPITRRIFGKSKQGVAMRHGAMGVRFIDKMLFGTDKGYKGLLYPVVSMAQATGTTLAKGANKFLGANFAITPVEKALYGIISQMEKSIKAGKQFNLVDTMRQYDFAAMGVSKHDTLAILDALEKRGVASAEVRAVREVVQTNDDILWGIRETLPSQREIGVKGQDLSRQQQDLIGEGSRPRGVTDPEEIDIAVGVAKRGYRGSNYSKAPIMTSSDSLHVSPDHITIKLASPEDGARLGVSQRANELGDLGVPGVLPFTTVEDETGFYVTMRNGGVNREVPWTQAHIENLEKIAALLHQKGYALADLSPSRVLAGPNGEVQIIDPLAIINRTRGGGRGQFGSIRTSRNSIKFLLPKVGLSADYSFPILGALKNNTKATNAVKATDIFLDDLVPSAKRLKGDETVRYFNVEDLLSSHNVGWLNELSQLDMEELGIMDLALRMQQEGVVEPVRIRVDDFGRTYIASGMEQLLAAREAGINALPVIREDFVGEVLRHEGGVVAEGTRLDKIAPPSRNVMDAMTEQPNAWGRLNVSVPNARGPIIKDSLGRHVVLDPDDVFRKLHREDWYYRFLNWFSRRASQDPTVRKTFSGETIHQLEVMLDQALTGGTYEGQRQAFLKLQDAIKSADDPAEFLSRIDSNIVLPHENNPALQGDYQRMTMELGVLRADAADIMEDIAANGLVRDFDEASTYSLHSGNTVIQYDATGVTITNPRMSVDDLGGFAKDYLYQEVPDLARGTKVHLSGDVMTTTTVDELVPMSPKLMHEIIPAQTQFFLTDATRQRLAKLGIFVNPDEAVLKAARMADRGDRILKGADGVVMFSMSGSMIYGLGVRHIDELLGHVFGEQGPRFAQEFGLVTKDGIQLNNLLGMAQIQALNRGGVAPIEARIKGIARRLVDAGFDDSMSLDFTTAVGDMFDELYKKNTTLREILDDDWKLHIPEHMEGMNFRLYDQQAVMGVGSKADSLPAGPVRELYNWAESELNRVALQELNHGLPLKVREGYFPRFLSPELLAKLDELGVKFFDKANNKKYFDYYIKNFKGRSLSELTTTEVNQLFKDLQLGKELAEFDKQEGIGFLKQLAAVDPDAAMFFIEDPILAVHMRKNLSIEAIAQKEAWDEIIASGNSAGVLFNGTVKEFKELHSIPRSIDRTKEAIAKITETLEEHMARLEKVSDDPELAASVQRTIDRTHKALEAKTQQLIDLEELRLSHSFPLQSAQDELGYVTINTSNARTMLEEGQLSLRDIAPNTNWGAPFVKVNADTVLRKIPGEKATITVLTREADEFLSKYYAALSKESNTFFRFFDWANNLYKQSTLFLFPASLPYNIRNFFSNVLLGYMGDIDPASYQEAVGYLSQIHRYNRGGQPIASAREALQSVLIRNNMGEHVTLEHLWSEFIRQGGMGGGLHINEFGTSREVLKRSIKAGFTPASNLVSGTGFLDSKLVSSGRRMSERLENWFRFTAFLDGWKKTGDFGEAALNVKKLYYNYDELSMFERKVLKRVIPFYSWMRFNTPRMMETIATNPIKHVRLKQSIVDIERGAGGPADDSELPEWLQRRWGITVARDGNRLMVSDGSFLLPMGDLYRLLRDPAQFALDGVTPLLKYPIEQLTNKSLFTWRDIQRVPGEPARSGFLRDKAMMSRKASMEGPLGAINLLWNESIVQNVRAAKWCVDWIDFWTGDANMREENPTLLARLTDALFSRAYSIDPYQTQAIVAHKAERLISNFKVSRKLAARRGDQTLVNYYNSRITQVRAQR